MDIDFARTGDDGVEHAFGPEENIHRAFYGLYVHFTIGIHGSQIAGAEDQLFAGAQLAFFAVAVDLEEDDAAAGEALHDEAFSAEESDAKLFLEKDGLLDIPEGCQVSAFLHDKVLPGFDFDGEDLPDKVTGKSDKAAAVGDIFVDEGMLAGEHPAEELADSAAGGGLHLHVRTHPGHSAGLALDFFSVVQVHHQNREGFIFNFIIHCFFSFRDSCFRYRIPVSALIPHNLKYYFTIDFFSMEESSPEMG